MESIENTSILDCVMQIQQELVPRDFSDINLAEHELLSPSAHPQITYSSENFCASFLADPKSEEAIARWLHPEGVICPGCKKSITEPTITDRYYYLQENAAEGLFWDECRCPDCRMRFTPWTNTLLEGAQNKRAAFLIIILFWFHVDLEFIATLTGQHIDTVRVWVKKAQEMRDKS